MKKYIHYGHEHFDKNLFKNISNRESLPTKPSGGLWASDIRSKFGWKDWCERENYCECNINNSFTFSLSPDAKVLKINSVGDLKSLPKVEKSIMSNMWELLDFEKLAQQYDAIEVNISCDGELYWSLYGWDCDSVLVMNPDIVIKRN